MTFLEELFELQDEKYADFQAKLTPGIERARFIGVRIPEMRKLAKRLSKDENRVASFMKEVPHFYYDENMLHGLLISEMKDYTRCMEEMELFLPYIDNWAVCDITAPKIFKKHKAELLPKIEAWCKSDYPYTIRFGMEMLMSHFLDEDFKACYLEIPASVHSEEYYVNMMSAWFYATALYKRWDETIPYLQNHRLDLFVHNKTIQKGKESFRIEESKKTYLNSLKRKE